jgi:hypothetical protein
MTCLERVDAIAARFLSQRTYDLIVAPAIADIECDASGTPLRPARDYASVFAAFAGAVYEDMTANGTVLRVAGLAVIPAAYYYFFLILLAAPQSAAFAAGSPLSGWRAILAGSFGHLSLAVLIALLSLAPVLTCWWPERVPRRARRGAADA